MTKKEKIRLVKQIASMAERAYRRGFQHGGRAGLSEKDEYRFRFDFRSVEDSRNNFYSRSSRPPEWGQWRYVLKSGCSAVERLETEIPYNEAHDELLKLLRESKR
jgi:hypothetical protein